jgi:hypothetical protein
MGAQVSTTGAVADIGDKHNTNRSWSCPLAWCNKLGLFTAFAGLCRVGQVATAGSPTRGVWLNGAMVSSVM